MHNLAGNPAYAEKKAELKKVLFNWLDTVGDVAEIPEREMVQKWWGGKDEPPVTATPVIEKMAGGVRLFSDTPGASIGYRIFEGAIRDTTVVREINTWDFYSLWPRAGDQTLEVPIPWKVYSGGMVPLEPGQTILVNAHRIGYRPSEHAFQMNE